jgi:thiamine-monophosphate kinase
MNEFELIKRFFHRTNPMPGVVVGIGDDGAVLAPDPNKQQIQVIDTLVEGVHFPPQTNAADIAYRAVAVNLSDIAAMGAEPRWMTLALTLSSANDEWLESFARGLFEAADEHQVSLIGGDTTSGQAVVVTVAISGEVEPGKALLRSAARAGDSIYVTGTVGDAAAGLQLQQRGESDDFLSSRFLRPTPRIAIGRALVGVATAAIDVSDGLAGDLQKLLLASEAGAEIEIATLPLSDALRARFDREQQLQFALQGGDDYELCFTSSDPSVDSIAGVTRIGQVTAGTELVFHHNGDVVEVDASGYRHFA